VANGYGVTLVPEVAVDVEVRDERVKLLRFAPPQPGRTIGLAWRQSSPRKVDFVALGQVVTGTLGRDTRQRSGSAPNPKFAHIVPRVRPRTSGSKGH
jgi:LysR family hydrogen peroxide-inducible transcriptional activator